MKIKREFALRSIAGDNILVPLGSTAMDLNGLVILNDVGARIWRLLPGAEDAAAIVDTLLEEYEVDRPTLVQDVQEFLDQMHELRIL